MKKFLVTIILLVTMVLSNWATSSYNAMVPSTGRDFWLTYMQNRDVVGTNAGLQLELFAVAQENATIEVWHGSNLLASQSVAAGSAFTYRVPTAQQSAVYNTGSESIENSGVHVTSTGNIALYLRNGYAEGAQIRSYDVSPVYATPTLGQEYMVQTYTRDKMNTEFAIVATENGTHVKIGLSENTLNNVHSKGDTIEIYLNAGQVYQLKCASYKSNICTGSLTGTTIESSKPVAVFNGGMNSLVPVLGVGIEGDHLCEQAIPISSWGKNYVLMEMNGFPDADNVIQSSPVQYIISSIYDDNEVYVDNVKKATLNKGGSYTVTVAYNQDPKVVKTTMPSICYGYMTYASANYYGEDVDNAQSYGQPSMILIPAIDKGVTQSSTYISNDVMSIHYANIVVESTTVPSFKQNGISVAGLFTQLGDGTYWYARVPLTTGINTFSCTNGRFIASAYSIMPNATLSEAVATTFNMSSAAPKVYIDNELVDDGEVREYCNKHPGIPFRAEVDYPHDSIKWIFGDGQERVLPAAIGSDYSDQHTYNLAVHSASETNHIKFIVYHHTPIANKKLSDTVAVDLVVYPAYYIHIYDTICGSTGSYTWTLPDGVTTIRTYSFGRKDNLTKEDKEEYQTHVGLHCDSIYYLHLRVYPETVQEIEATICQSETYNNGNFHINGRTLAPKATPYEYFDTLYGENQYHCDSIRHLKLTVLRSDSTEFNASACDSYTWAGTEYTASGNYIKEFTNAAGCDSVVTMHLTIKHSSTPTTDTQIACESYTWKGTTYNTSGEYTKTLTNAVGCDSVVTLHLTIKYNQTYEFNASACDSYTWDGTTYTTSGNYQKVYTIAAGCDSTVTMHLTINHSVTGPDTTAVKCGSFTWHGDTYNQSGDYTWHGETAAGCDSAVTLHLTVYPVYNETIPETACGFYTWHGVEYTTSGDYTWEGKTIHDCDSIVTLHLTILTPHTEPTVTSICQGEQYVWNYNPLGKYNGQTFETNQKLADTVSCGAIYTLNLTVLPRPTVTSISVQGGTNQCLEQNTTLNYQVSSNAATYEYAIYGNGTIIDPVDPDDPSDLPPHPAPHRAGALISKTGTIDGNSLVMNTASLTAGTYEVHFVVKSTDNCVSDTAKVSFRILAVKDSVQSDTICYDGSLLWFGTHYNTAGTFYHTDKYANGCDSVHYTLHLTRLNVKEEEAQPESVCKESLPFLWRGHEYYTSGTYHDTIYYRNGCDSVHYTLDLQVQEIDTIQPPISAKVCKGNLYTWDGGDIDTDTLTVGTHHFYSPVATAVGECLREVKHLVLTVQAVPTPTERKISACESYTWNGTTYTESGDYTYTHTVGSCEVTDILHLTIGQPWDTTVYKTIHPQKTAFSWDEFKVTFQNVNQPGTYTKDKKYKTTGTNCDSIYHLTLIVTDKIDSTLHHTMCSGDTYSWRGTNYTTTGVYTDDTTNPDTTFILDLKVQKRTEKTPVTKHICDATSFTWTLPDGTVAGTYNTNGTYEYTQHYATGCDSVHHTLNLTFGTPNTGEAHETVCAGKFYTYNNTTITTEYGHDFTYEKTLTNASGCDSVVTVHVHVARSDKSGFPAESCGQYIWEGQKYTTSGDYQFTYTNNEGCDSVVTMHLTIHNVLNKRLDEELNEGEKFEWHRGLNGDTTITTAGTYYDHNTSIYGCDSTYILHVQYIKAQRDTVARTACDSYKWGDYTYTESGIYGDTVWSTDHKSYTAIHYVNLTINESKRYGYEAQTICEGDAVEMNGENYHPTTTGWLRVESTTDKGCLRIDSMFVTVKTVERKAADNIEVCETELPYEWHGIACEAAGTYGDTLRYDNGCDSIIYTLKLTVNTVTPDQEFNRTTCQLTTYKWTEANMPINCRDYEPGTYPFYKDTVYPGECDESHLTLNLTIMSSEPTVVYDTICYGDSYDWYIDGELRMANLTSTCTQYDTIHNDDCDLSYRLELEVREQVEPQIDDTVYLCALDEPIQWHNMTLGESGTYTFRKEKAAQDGHCDSIYQITVVRAALEQKDYTGHACLGDDYIWNDRTIAADELSLGVNHFYDTVPAVAPAVCPTIVNHLVLTVTRPHSEVENVIACEEYTWRGRHYIASINDTIFVPAAENSCDSTFILHLTIGHNFEKWDATTITKDQLPYTWHHTTFEGAASKDETYHNAATGCDSIWHLTLTVSELIPDTTLETICEGETYKWEYDNIVYNKTGIFSCTTMDKQPHLLYLTVRPNSDTIIYVEDCIDSYNWHGEEKTVSGEYTWTGVNLVGCDSIETLHLTLLDRSAQNESRTVCPGEQVIWGNTNHTAVAGEAIDLYRLRKLNATCSIEDTLHLIVRAAVSGEQTESACASFEWHGTTYTESGDYTWTGATAAGCDSVVTLHLTINEPFFHSEDVEVHEDALPYYWTGHKGDTAISNNGDYYERLHTVDDCDSIYHLHLHIGFVARDTTTMTECDSYKWHGTTYTESSGLHPYTDTVWNSDHSNYDAIHYLNLTINHSVHVEESARQYCEGESFDWKGRTHTLPVGDTTLVYKTTTPEGCDSITTMQVTILSKYGHAETATVCWTELPYIWRGIACNEAKTYADTVQSMNGCDSILTLTLTVLQPQTLPAEDEQEICLSNTYTWHGMSIHKSEIGTYDYYYRYMNQGDCDSITDHLTLTVKENKVDTIHDISCYGADYTWTVEDDIVLFHGDPTADLWKVDTVHNPLCDHVYVLDLKIMPKAVTVTTDTTICAGSDYLWPVNGQSYSKTGLYADTLRSILSECDSVIRQLDLKVRPLVENPITLQLCEGSSYKFFGEEFTNLQAGTTIEREHIEKYVGCDCDSAITTLSLTVVPTLIDESNPIVTCGKYTWNDVTPARTYTNISNVPNAENLYINDTVITQNGQCATKHILHLTLQPTYELYADTAVRSLPLVYKGIYFNSTEAVVTIDTTVTMHASTTCDSIYHISVVKTDKEIKNETATICEGETFNWRGDTYTTAGNYVNTTAHPDTVYTLVLTVNPMTRHEADNITTCDETYTWHGHTLTESTICYDTVAGLGDACGEIYTLNLTMVKAEATSEYDTICTNMLPYTWAGRGTYPIVGTDTMLLSEYTLLCGETITDTMRVHVWPTAKSEESMTTCSNEPVIWNGTQYNTTGDYTWTGVTSHGCDSVATLHLTVLEAFISDEHLEVAEGPLEWRGQLLTEDGIYTDSLTKVENGCDSIYRVNFHINIAERDTTREQECGSYTWSQTGETYTESTVARDTVWNATHTNYTVYSLELTIWPKYDYIADTDTAAIKMGETYEWYGNTYTTKGDYTHMVTTIHGCDSLLASLHLIVGDPIKVKWDTTACENEGFEFKGKKYTESTILYDSLKTTEGLDSINVINLTIWPTVTHTLEMIACEKFEWNGFEFRNDTVLEIHFSSEVTGCDSIDRLELTITDSIILVPGNEFILDELGYCPGDTAYIPYNLLKGDPTEYKLDFDPKALEQGFVPHGYKPLTGHNDIPIAIPENCDAGTYVAILQLTDKISDSREYRFEFTVAYDGVLHTMWNDVLAIDNSKGLFFDYRWFRDGIEILGANKQYYNQDGEPLKGEYRAGLMLKNEMWIYTCPLYVDMTNEPLSLTAMPCPAPKGMPVTLTIHGADLETLENGVLYVYSISGQIVYRRDGAERQQQVDLTTGQYIGVFRTNDDRSVNVKFLVY